MNPARLIFVVATGLLSCGPSGKPPQEGVAKETVHAARNYEYADASGKRLILENGGPKGEAYTDPIGKQYFKTIFWTRITNETDSALELNMDIPDSSYELPSSPGRHFSLLLPPDTLKPDHLKLPNFGLADITASLPRPAQKPTSFKRTIRSKESSGFYLVVLFEKGVTGPFRAELSIKEQHLVYRIARYESRPAGALIDEKEIKLGSIGVRNFVLQR